VLFVMTDVVGSTALWEAHGESMRSALEVHDGLVHGAIKSAGGRVFKHTGDGMIAVFDDADGAVAGALHAVDALTGAQWGDTGALEVRVSVHAGSASERRCVRPFDVTREHRHVPTLRRANGGDIDDRCERIIGYIMTASHLN
jgi:class 3 adenylate cyclase